MRVKFRKSHPNFGYFAGDNAEIDDNTAGELLEKGYVILVPSEEIDPVDENQLPENLPGRILIFKAGINSVEELKLMKEEDFTSIKGIGPKMAEQIVEFVSIIE